METSLIDRALVVAGASLAPIPIGYLVEALRTAPKEPERLPWAPDIPVRHVTVDGMKMRYVMAGDGPVLLLLHTLRTQLDMFQIMIPTLARHFRVVALDYPGHGYSDIPPTEQSPEFFYKAVTGFVETLDLNEITVAGESIGATLGLMLAGRRHPRVRRVVAISAYDYCRGLGVTRGSRLAGMLFGVAGWPVLGATFWRLRTYPVFAAILRGGVVRKGAFPDSLLLEMHRVGNRPGHMGGFLSLIKHLSEWEQARTVYSDIEIPTLLVYGERDWSLANEREATCRAIRGTRLETIADRGHFLSVDAPAEVAGLIIDFAGT